jgi:hypothetical protein
MTRTPVTKPYILGLSIGTFWLIAASSGFSIQMMALTGTSNAMAAIVPVVVGGLTLLAISFRQILAAIKLPPEPRSSERRKIGRRFVWIVILEVVVIMAVNAAGFFSGHLSLLVPLDLTIVGIHFFPLAKLFGVPRYTALGSGFCIVSTLTLLIVPADAHIGGAIARFLISSLGCAAAAWLTSIANQFEIRRLLSDAGTLRRR